MAMQLQKIGRYDAAIFLPDGEYDTVFYSVEVNADAAKRTWDALQAPRYAMVVALGMDWFDDLTPWPAPNVYDGLAPFGGKADALLEYFETQLVPQAEAISAFVLCSGDLRTACCPSGHRLGDSGREKSVLGHHPSPGRDHPYACCRRDYPSGNLAYAHLPHRLSPCHGSI